MQAVPLTTGTLGRQKLAEVYVGAAARQKRHAWRLAKGRCGAQKRIAERL